MLYAIYIRWTANIVDLRLFSGPDEMAEWAKRQVKHEPTSILGIYEKSERDECFEDLVKYEEYFKSDKLKLCRKITADEWRYINKEMHNGYPMRMILYELGLLSIKGS